jgi:hypothetical protein
MTVWVKPTTGGQKKQKIAPDSSIPNLFEIQMIFFLGNLTSSAPLAMLHLRIKEMVGREGQKSVLNSSNRHFLGSNP